MSAGACLLRQEQASWSDGNLLLPSGTPRIRFSWVSMACCAHTRSMVKALNEKTMRMQTQNCLLSSRSERMEKSSW